MTENIPSRNFKLVSLTDIDRGGKKMSYSSLMPANKDKWSPQRCRERLKFPQGATDTVNRGRRTQPVVAYHNIPTVKEPAPRKNNQRADREHGNRRPSGATSNMTDIPVKHPVHQNPRQDRGRSTERTTEKRGSSVRSSSCEVAYSSRGDTKNPSLCGPLDDVFKALKDGGLRSKLSDYVDSHEKLKAERDYLKSQVSLYKLKLSTTKDLDERLSNLMGSNERYLENVSEKIRPSTLVERFKALESTEWLKAKEAMDKHFGEDNQSTFHLLCSTLTVAFQFAREQIQELYHHQNDILRGCIHSEESVIAKTHSPSKSVEEERLPVSLRDMLTKRWRSNAEKCSIQQLEKKTVSVLSKAFEWQFKEIEGNHVFGQYLSACCRLAWQMNIMQPPMYISVEGGSYNERNHRVWYTCETSPNARVRFYVWPSLYDCVGGNLLQQGLVYLDKSRTGQHQTSSGIVAARSLAKRHR